jgi:hypothetical protein
MSKYPALLRHLSRQGVSSIDNALSCQLEELAQEPCRMSHPGGPKCGSLDVHTRRDAVGLAQVSRWLTLLPNDIERA